MLTKSQARFFFVAGTLLFTGVFLLLTIDTVRKVPNQTHQQNLTEAVNRGKEIWDKNNCMGCHTILGEGAYYAPELTKVIERRGKDWIKIFLKDPQAMYPGERKMINYHFNNQQIDDLIAFFDWIGKMDLNGFPAKPNLQVAPDAASNTSVTTDTALLALQPATFKNVCSACHSVSGAGGNVGPALDTVGRKFDEAYLHKWIKDPQSVKADTKMPKLPLSDADVNALVVYLGTLK